MLLALKPLLAAAAFAAAPPAPVPGARQHALRADDPKGEPIILGVLQVDFGKDAEAERQADAWEKRLKSRKAKGADRLTVGERWVFSLPAPAVCIEDLPAGPNRLVVRFEEQRDPFEIDVAGWRNACFLVGRANEKSPFRPVAVFREVLNVSVSDQALKDLRKSNRDADRHGTFDAPGGRKGRWFRDFVGTTGRGRKVFGGHWLAATGSRSNVGLRMVYPAASAELAEDFAERAVRSLDEKESRGGLLGWLRKLG